MNIKYIVKKQQLDIMKLRARSMSTKPRSVLEDDIRHLSELLLAVTNQRDEWIRTYNRLINERHQ